ncbi:group II intron reverse transcriptase/maturase [Candidatus Parcubacteria bacterium]|nr:MAG: group II intron reverse transcriptase/maturase [Candidatus Parcubacteria bacterium]
MGVERRDSVKQPGVVAQPGPFREEVAASAKPFVISKRRVYEAYRLVKANAGSAGVDRQSLAEFEENLKDNLYKLWNRMSSGSYMPPPVKAVAIPKKVGGERILGVPTVSDRIAQMVVKLEFEPDVEPHFLPDSYGYRPNKSALDAIGVTRKRCWRHDWVVEFDIKGLFDNIPHDLLMKAVEKHTTTAWVKLYIRRWLTAPMQMPDGSQRARAQGTPQGGVISPLLANLFLHYVFDKWLQQHYPHIEWCRYADDGLLHCNSEAQARFLLKAITQRFAQCGLELHPEKTQIVYCKDGRRTGEYPNTAFDFLGYTFRRRGCWVASQKRMILGFSPAVSRAALKAMRRRIRKTRLRSRTELTLQDIARRLNPAIRGWLAYYGKYYRSAMYALWRHINKSLVRWAMRKYKALRSSKTRAIAFLEHCMQQNPGLFVHWREGMKGAFA